MYVRVCCRFQDPPLIPESAIHPTLRARAGTAMQLFGFFMLIEAIHMLVPFIHDQHFEDDITVDDRKLDDEEMNDPYFGDGKEVEAGMEGVLAPWGVWRPLGWKRGTLLFAAYCMNLFLVFIMEFSYSHWYSTFQFEFIIFFKFFQIALDMFVGNFINETLLTTPLFVAVGVVEVLITMGAEDFTDFTTAFFVDTAMAIFERVYLDPTLKSVLAHWPKWTIQLRRKFRKNRALITREQRKKEDAEWKAVLEDIARETEGVEPLLDSYSGYAVGLMALFMSPILQVFLLMTDTTPTVVLTEIPELYGIRATDLSFYTIFSFVIIPATLGLDIFLFNTLELVHGWRLYDYVSYQKYRFSVRDHRWQMTSEAYDESISEGLQSTDLMCFSSQFYFICSFMGYAMFLCIVGIEIHLRTEHNPFGDQTTYVACCRVGCAIACAVC